MGDQLEKKGGGESIVIREVCFFFKFVPCGDCRVSLIARQSSFNRLLICFGVCLVILVLFSTRSFSCSLVGCSLIL